MGYLITQEDADFFVAKKDVDAFVADAKKALTTLPAWCHRGYHDRLQSLSDVLDCWSYQATLDAKGNIVGLEFLGEKLLEQPILWDAVAPLVREGSYLEMLGEDGARWRWVFKDEKMVEVFATISWG